MAVVGVVIVVVVTAERRLGPHGGGCSLLLARRIHSAEGRSSTLPASALTGRPVRRRSHCEGQQCCPSWAMHSGPEKKMRASSLHRQCWEATIDPFHFNKVLAQLDRASGQERSHCPNPRNSLHQISGSSKPRGPGELSMESVWVARIRVRSLALRTSVSFKGEFRK